MFKILLFWCCIFCCKRSQFIFHSFILLLSHKIKNFPNKNESGLDYEWCKSPDKGIIRPDMIFFLRIATKTLVNREGFGDEIYEKEEFQGKVGKYFEKMFTEIKKGDEESVFMIDCCPEDNITDIHQKILKIIEEKHGNWETTEPLKKLEW